MGKEDREQEAAGKLNDQRHNCLLRDRDEGAKWADVHPGLPGMQANSLMLRKNILKHFVHTICDAEYIKYWWNAPQQQY